MITSPQNPLIKEFRRLQRDKRARQEAGLFVVEGIQGVVAAVDSPLAVETVVFVPDLLTSEVAEAALARAVERGVRCEAVTATIFEALSARENPVGIAALVRQPDLSLTDLLVTPGSVYVALIEISDPGNLGTIIRTVDAVGGDGVLLVGKTVDPFHPGVVKASAGTIFSTSIVTLPTLEALFPWLQQYALTVVSTSDRGEHSFWQFSYTMPLLILMGSEAHGLPGAALERFTSVCIPMHGKADSLNLAVATALVLYEVRRQNTLPSAR